MTTSRSEHGGFTLVELLVVMAISLIAMVAIYGIFISSSDQARRTQQITDMWQQAQAAMNMVTDTTRQAGYGLDSGGCSQTLATVNAGNSTINFVPIQAATQSAPQYDPTAHNVSTQSLTVRMATSSNSGFSATSITKAPANTAANFSVDNTSGLAVNDLLLIKMENGICAVAQITGPSNLGNGANTVVHNSGGNNYNIAGGIAALGQNANPSVTVTAQDLNGASLYDMGQGNHTYTFSISNTTSVGGTTTSTPTLVLTTQSATSTAQTHAIATGIVDLQLLFGYAINPGQPLLYGPWNATQVSLIRSVRIYLLARSPVQFRNYHAPASIALYNLPSAQSATGSALSAAYTVTSTDQGYRYQLFQNEVPLLNLVWAAPPS
ncbi:PilW family protein [Thiomonas sp.]